MRVIQVVGGHKPQGGSRLNIFVHRQISSLNDLIPETYIVYAGLGSSIKDMTSLLIKLKGLVTTFKPDVIHSQYATVTGAVTIMAAGEVPTVVSFGGDEIY